MTRPFNTGFQGSDHRTLGRATDMPYRAECHLEPDINDPADASDLLTEALDGDLEFFSLPLDAAF